MKPLPRRALVSVYDKTGVVALARRLASLGFQILSTGGTAEALRRDGLDVTDVSRHTGQPEILGGRVKTLHPRIHGGLLGDPSEASHRADMERSSIEPIGLAVVNLYPFRSVAAQPDAPLGELIEMIDIGGPAMIRSAAKNHAAVGVLVDPGDYGPALDEIEKTGGLSDETRRRLAAKAFAHTAAYDADIRDTLSRRFAALDRPRAGDAAAAPDAAAEFPETIRLEFTRKQSLRYGENPHQKGALYVSPAPVAGTVAQARQVQGKELSYNNLLDLDAAWRLVREFARPAAVIVKHNNPCGVACAATLAEAFEEARKTDPVSAFGGIVAFNRELDAGGAAAAAGIFLECLIAPSIAPGARDALQAKTGLRVLEAGTPDASATAAFDVRSLSGGLLVQDADGGNADVAAAKVVTRRAPTAEERRALAFAWKVAKHVKSNAIVVARGERTLGVGAGQMSRVDSVRLAVGKAQEPVAGGVLASDAFFPFRDGLDEAAKAGVTAVVQPGGSIRDEEIIAAADEHGLAMVVTGLRHFRH
jgi:phosphoribosylaminoimidazolecarboxamide formyltransferase/IMP cyclohydrolase